MPLLRQPRLRHNMVFVSVSRTGATARSAECPVPSPDGSAIVGSKKSVRLIESVVRYEVNLPGQETQQPSGVAMFCLA